METYEIINPSDCYTFHAESDKTARLVTLLVGQGDYECEKEDGETLGCLMFLMTSDEFKKALNEMFPEGLKGFIATNKEEIIKALESVISFDRKERNTYDEALKALDPSKVEDFRAKVHDKNRSSLNDIGTYAWHLAKRMRDKT